MGVRARVRVKLHWRKRWEENTYRFTRARFNFNGLGWGTTTRGPNQLNRSAARHLHGRRVGTCDGVLVSFSGP
jgi:hypothetical protein